MPLRQRIARVVALLLLLPAGLVCLAVPVWILTLPGRSEIFGDTHAAFGGGTDAGALRASYVDCTAERSGSGSGRGIGMTDYGCVIDLTTEPKPAATPTPAPSPTPSATAEAEGADPYAGMSYEESTAAYNAKMAEWNAVEAERMRQYHAEFDRMAAENRARATAPSNRLERQLATNRSGQLPTVRLLSAPGEPRRIGLVWGFGELAWRWGQWLVTSLLFFGFGGACLFAVWIAWRRRVAG